MSTIIMPHETGQVEIQRRIEVEVDGEVFRKTKRYVLTPDPLLNPPKSDGTPWDMEDEPEEVRVFCEAWWTVERVTAWQAFVADMGE
ncbi:hypothetical protein [Sphingobium sp. CAP-1]|uniref:hypothetical protein n=1 Tax=Sphingobium sp. CAP-1 TaxID=2676077 RepID=UPI0012BB461A|nr:hypothetical protein [Sphingobium sp. CAP-1]QGP79994.1 hypothetical protein GL174_14130 [Sphingobium sp. CAP-1]